ncbi:Aste57867_10658 [Aphanomyces stellatus]|uniref:subtilisin n=1 Tax=Aphanomyces stellatus TaxID=120398 RepID=A0A485KR13_9STRA|nr:hypothetical protein As57867_010618 [Aphanomyces stellatus]VFT87530.1 Aste57867_10658 [Aphanomyces stellatus]
MSGSTIVARAACIFAFLATAMAAVPSSKIAPDVWADLQHPSASVSVLVSFQGGTHDTLADTTDYGDLDQPSSNIRVRDSLIQLSMASQTPVLALLHPNQTRRLANSTSSSDDIVACPGLESLRLRQIYLTNQLHIRSLTRCMAEQLALRPEVTSIRYGVTLTLDNVIDTVPATTNSNSSWGITTIAAPDLWAAGFSGQGIVVGSIDSGVRGSHDAVRRNFRADHGWFDATTNKAPFPVDVLGHGTHTMGIIQAVAPDAQWISCRACGADGSCKESDLLVCMQFMLCPTDATGQFADCAKAPRVVNNSWGAGGRANFPNYKAAVAAWRHAGIVPVFSNGNNGNGGCGTVGSPADYDDVISVGSIDSTGHLASTSSRGPTVQGRVKPDVVAPGMNIMSASSQGDDLYVSMSGTSMAAPHVTAAIALLLSANPHLTYDDLYTLLTTAARDDGVLVGEIPACTLLASRAGTNSSCLTGHGLVHLTKGLSIVRGTTATSELTPTMTPASPATTTSTTTTMTPQIQAAHFCGE